MQTKTLINPSFVALCYELIEAGAEGWKIAEDDQPYQMGYGAYYVGLIKVEEHRAAVLEIFPDQVDMFIEEHGLTPTRQNVVQIEKRPPGRPRKDYVVPVKFVEQAAA